MADKKRSEKEPVEGNVLEAMRVVMSADALSAKELERLPALRAESERDQGIVAMVAVGFSQADVAAAFDMTQQAVSKIVRRIDPTGAFRLNPKAKKAFISKLAEGRGMAALASITLNEISGCTPVEKMRIAKMGMEISQSLNQGKHSGLGGSKLDDLMEQIEKERLAKMKTAEVEEI